MTWQGGQRGSSDGIGEFIATALGFVRPWDILFINLFYFSVLVRFEGMEGG